MNFNQIFSVVLYYAIISVNSLLNNFLLGEALVGDLDEYFFAHKVLPNFFETNYKNILVVLSSSRVYSESNWHINKYLEP
jgi:hypothetical protein